MPVRGRTNSQARSVLLPALAEVTWKVSCLRPVRFSLIESLTVFVRPAVMPPTVLEALAPPPVTFSLTPVADALPPLVIFTVKAAFAPFFTLDGPLTATLLILAFGLGWSALTTWFRVGESEDANRVLPE